MDHRKTAKIILGWIWGCIIMC